MSNFENWLILEEIRTDIYESSINKLFFEQAARITLEFLFESLDEEDDGPVELEDPFSDDEDAQPYKTYKVEDEEEIKKTKTRASQEFRKLLKNTTLWMRWKAIAERKADIEKIKRLRKEYEKSSRKNEEVDPEEEEFENLGKSAFDLGSVVPLLEKLGYLKNDQNLSNEEIVELMNKASEETGNDLPSDLKEEELFSNWENYIKGKDEKLKPSVNLNKASEDFFMSIKEIFKKSFYKLRNSSSGAFNQGGKVRYGTTMFSDVDDVASSFAMMMIDQITERPWKWEGATQKLLGWYGTKNSLNMQIKKLTKKDLENHNEKQIEKIIGFFRTYIGKLYSKEQSTMSKTLSPKQRTSDSVRNKSSKAALINKDVDSENFDFYVKFLNDHSRGVENSVSWWVENNPEAKKAKKQALSGISKDDVHRTEIMSHILFLQSRHSEMLSLNPSKIKETLLNYRQNFLLSSTKAPLFFGAMGRKDSDDGEELYDPTADDTGTSEDPLGIGASQNPANIAASNEYQSKLNIALYHALSFLNPQERLAICVKWGLNCTSGGAVISVDAFKQTSLRLTKAGKIVGGNKTDCASRLEAIGLNAEETAKELSKISGADVSTNNARNWIKRGLNKICYRLPIELNKATRRVTPMPMQRSINRRFDASRKSPLSVNR